MANIPRTKNLLNLTPEDVSKMSDKELRDAVSILASAANKRLKRLSQSKSGEQSPAFQSAMKRPYTGAQGGKFGTSGKTTNQLRNEFKNIKNFMNMKTGSVSGWKKFREKTYDRIGTDFENDEDLEKKFWSNYRKIEEIHPNLKNQQYGSDRLQSDLARVMNEREPKEIIKEINEWNVSAKRTRRENYISGLTENYSYVDNNHRRRSFDPHDDESVIELMNEYVGVQYEKEQQSGIDETSFRKPFGDL